MRNIAQYPITLDEMIEAVEAAHAKELKEFKAAPSKYPVGGIYMEALLEAANRLKRLQFAAE